jgi:hypothetical protein
LVHDSGGAVEGVGEESLEEAILRKELHVCKKNHLPFFRKISGNFGREIVFENKK